MKFLLTTALLLSALARAQSGTIPPDIADMGTLTATEFARGIRVGWNVGNSLEAIGGETSWGNPKVSQTLIDSVKAAGFNAIRLPVAWSQFSDATTYTINPTWLARVEEVVNYALKRDMYVILNEHWDGGWLQPTNAAQAEANRRLTAIWKQVAVRFRDYGSKLLFAGTNEVMVDGDYGTPTAEYVNVQNGYNQNFVNTVRATGGRNAYRYLVVQGFNTNITHTLSSLKIPADVVQSRMMVEVHFYDPYDFTLKESSTITQWGASATDPSKVASWGNEANVDAQFSKMKSNFGDKGYPVVIGEYGAIARTTVPDHAKYRLAWTKYVTESAIKNGLLPFYWDNGGTGNLSLGLFDRSTGKSVHPAILQGVVGASPIPVAVQRSVPGASGLTRAGDRLQAQAPITLHDLSGAAIRSSRQEAASHALELTGVPAGLYVARTGSHSMTILAR